MNPVRTTIAAGLALIALAGGAQAADIYSSRDYGGDRYATSRYDRYETVVQRDEIRPRHRFDEGFEEHVERRGSRGDGGERYAFEGRDWSRPVYGRPGFAPYDDCRVIVRRKINHWGEMVVRRIRICR